MNKLLGTDSIENHTVPVKIKTAALVIFSTISIQASLTAIYLNLRSDLKDLSTQQTMQNQINNLRFQNIETKQTEDRDWIRSVARRVSAIEQHQNSGSVHDDMPTAKDQR